MSAMLSLLAESAENAVELPMPPAAFGITAIIVFAALLGVVYSFKNVAHRQEGRTTDHGAAHH